MLRSRASRALFLAVAVLATVVFQVAYAAEGVDEPVRTSAAVEHQPSRSANYLAWNKVTRQRPNHGDVVAKADGGSPFRVNERGTEGSMGSLDGNRLVFQQFTRRRSNIFVMNLATRSSRPVGKLNTRQWEYWPRMDGSRFLFVRQNLRTGKRTLIFANTASGNSRALATTGAGGYLLPGQVSGDFAVWGEQKPGQVARVKRFQISTGQTTTIPNGGQHNWGASVTDRGTVYFGRSGRRCGTNTAFFRWSPGRGATQVIDLPNGVDMAASFVFETAEGKLQVFHDRAVCSRTYGVDIYRFIDPFTVTLTVTTSGNRTGTVTGPGVNCGTDCTQDFEPGSTVTLTATPEEGARFDAWSDPACGSEPTCTITITTDTTITASFRP